ncbi:MAG: amidase family protein, partial [Propionicimonas sp.]
MTDLAGLGALEVAAAVRAGELTATEVTLDALRRAEERGPQVGAFAFLAPERALAEAGRLDSRLARGEARDAALLGVPCPIKDLTEVEGLPFEAGSEALAGNVAVRTDPVAARLVTAGALVIGKTTTPEFGFPCYT